MKRLRKKILILTGGLLSLVAYYSCSKDFLEREPIGEISENEVNSAAAVNSLLIGAYAMLGDGNGANIDDGNTSVWNAWLGGVGADDARKGGGYGSQGERGEIENYSYTSENPILNDRWRTYYAGIGRANETIRRVDALPEGELSAAEALQIRAEAVFLRGVFHFEAAKTWRNIPYVDETKTYAAGNYRVRNDVSAWPMIEADFLYAAQNLTPTKAQIGRAHAWAAKAFLAKTYMFQTKFAEAKPVLEDVINNGTNSAGVKLALVPEFSQLFRAPFENSSESVFSVQISVNDGAQGANGSPGEAFNYPAWANPGGWGNQPSFSLANSYKTENGLPMFNTWNDVDLPNDMGLADGAPFTPYAGTLDPRLDWTVGRRGVPFHDYGLKQKWAGGEVGGPYRSKKIVHWLADKDGKGSEVIGGWQQANGTNYMMIRFADVLLWAAEAEVEIGSLDAAEDYVNIVRARAANPAGFLKKYNNDADPTAGFSATPAANYDIELYNGEFAAQGKNYARQATQWERKLEFAMEGHRFFDLQRYSLLPGQEPLMANILNSYITHEQASQMIGINDTYKIFDGAQFIQGKNEIYAIPLQQIDQSREADGPTLVQNPQHN